MMISIASGKGGTGKTTVATNLALSVNDGIQLLDCDVEAPNAHLFIRPVFEKIEIITTPVPVVDEKKCDHCGKCAEICQFKAIAVFGETVLTFPELCHSCGGCTAVCPTGAITETGRELGIIRKGFSNGLEFVHGELRVGEAMSPPLIQKVRDYSHPKKLTIIDAPPGTSCPVIAAVRNSHFVLLVTEPTPFGLHDLELAVNAIQLLEIPCGIVINRSDVGDDRVEAYAKRNDVPILMRIPFDRRIAEAYSKGKMIVEILPEYKRKFLSLFKHIDERTNHYKC
jgi:MinD superfamily P-loop ATPase